MRFGRGSSGSLSTTHVLAATAGAMVGAVVATAIIASVGHDRTVVAVATAAPLTVADPPVRGSGFRDVVAAVRPSVVSIAVEWSGGTDLGSGVVVRSDGFILTAEHVVAHAGAIKITLADGRASVARVVGREPRYDLALLRTSKLRRLTPVTFGSCTQVRAGDDVFVMGNPLGFAGTVSRGIISATGRLLPVSAAQPAPPDPVTNWQEPPRPTGVVPNALQTDAATNPGDSGGPLVNLAGHVIGIVTTAVSTRADSDPDTGLAFAVPSDLVWRITSQLLAHQR